VNGIVIEKNKDCNKEDFKSLAWVLRARSKDDMRPNLTGLHSDGMGKFIATDGHRMHIAEIPKLSETIPAGIWIYVHASSKKISLQQAPEDTPDYPDCQKVIDGFNNGNPVSKGMVFHIKGEDSNTVWYFHHATSLECNIDYLIDVLENQDPMNIRVQEGNELSPIELTGGGIDGNTQKAIIMPLKKAA